MEIKQVGIVGAQMKEKSRVEGVHTLEMKICSIDRERHIGTEYKWIYIL